MSSGYFGSGYFGSGYFGTGYFGQAAAVTIDYHDGGSKRRRKSDEEEYEPLRAARERLRAQILEAIDGPLPIRSEVEELLEPYEEVREDPREFYFMVRADIADELSVKIGAMLKESLRRKIEDEDDEDILLLH